MRSFCSVCFIISMLFLTMVGINAQPTDSLSAYYPFNGNANDESGNGLNGITTNTILILSSNSIQQIFLEML